MVDELRIDIETKQAERRIAALKNKLLSLMSKNPYKVKIIVDKNLTDVDKNLKDIQKKVVKSNKDTNTEKLQDNKKTDKEISNAELSNVDKTNNIKKSKTKTTESALTKIRRNELLKQQRIWKDVLDKSPQADAANREAKRLAETGMAESNVRKGINSDLKREIDLLGQIYNKEDSISKKTKSRHQMYKDMFGSVPDQYSKPIGPQQKTTESQYKKLFEMPITQAQISQQTKGYSTLQKTLDNHKTSIWDRIKAYRTLGRIKGQAFGSTKTENSAWLRRFKAKDSGSAWDDPDFRPDPRWNRNQPQAQQTGTKSGDGRILQMPQNPLLGRMAQFGMMASGMAATMFLMQMITAQMRMLMGILTEWEDAISKIIDSTSLTSDNMDGLAEIISEYARNLGVASTAMAEATGAAFQYGIDPTQNNVQQLYALQFSDNVKDYKEAASIMNMAGTEFGDNAAAAYIKKWDAYAGTGETSGTFGYEWDRLKESGKDAMRSIWDDGYGTKITNSLRDMSDWISNNRASIGSVFDKIVTTLKVTWEIFKVITPAVVLFLGAFVLTSGLQMFVWLLTSASKMFGPFSMGLTRAATEMAVMDKATLAGLSTMTKFKTILLGVTPAIIAVGVAFAGWELYKRIRDVETFAKKLRDLKKISPEDFQKMTEPDLASKKAEYEKLSPNIKAKIKFQEDLVAKYRERIKKNSDSPTIHLTKGFLSATEKSLKYYQDMLAKLGEGLNEIKLVRDTKLKDILKEFTDVKITIPWAEQLAALEKVNKELGITPILLAQMKAAMRKATAPKDIEAMGLGEQAIINAKANFQDKLKTDPEFKQIRDLITSAQKRDDPSLNAAQIKKIDWELIKGLMEEEISKVGLTEKKYASLTAGLKKLKEVFKNLNIESVTLNTDKYKDAMKALNEEIDHFNESDYQKKLREVDEQFGGDKGMKALLQERLYLEEKRKIERLQGRRPDDDQRKSDLEEAFKFDEKLLKIATKNLEFVGKLGSAERALLKERERGLGVISDTELKLKLKVDLLKIAIKYNLNPISDASLKRIEDSTKALSQYETIIKNLGREITIGQLQTGVDQGKISDLEKRATIERRIAQMEESIKNQGAAAGTPEQKKELGDEQEALIKYQENLRQLESFQNQASVAGMEQQYQIKKQMSDDYYAYQSQQISINYLKNEHDVGEHYAKMVEKEEEYQLALKNRRMESRAVDIAIGIEEANRKIADSYQTLGQTIESVITQAYDIMADGFTDALQRMIWDAETSFDQIFTSFAKMVTKMAIQEQIASPLSSFLSSGIGTFVSSLMGTSTGATTLSNGAIINPSGSVFNMAGGGVINEHVFGIGASTGRSYEFGEGGAPEIILPSKSFKTEENGQARTSNQRVELHFHNAPQVKKTEETRRNDGGQRMDVFFEEQVANVLGGQNSATSILENRYGLNAQLAGR